MRPEILNPVFADVTALPGVGPKIAAMIGRVAGSRIVDLILTLPINMIDRSARPKIAEAPFGQLATFLVTVDRHDPPPKSRRLPYKVICSDETGYMTLIFFHARADYLQKALPEGETRLVSGKIEDYSGGRQMVHPDYIADPDKPEDMPLHEPVYPLTAGLSSAVMRKATVNAVARAPKLDEWQDAAWLKAQDWADWHTALQNAHRPSSQSDLSPHTPTIQRLAYDELLANQLALLMIRKARVKTKGKAIKGDGRLRKKAIAALPFDLTKSQNHTLKEVFDDMAAPDRMVRLVQGDVGSGKTIVAFLAMLAAVEIGAQAALMAPTEILARQHMESLEALAKTSNVTMEILTGRDKGTARNAKLERLAAGDIDILIGTHAIFQEGVDYQNLAFVVIDEQHRFGVHQRISLTQKRRQAGLAGNDRDANPTDSGAHRLWRYGCQPDHRKTTRTKTRRYPHDPISES